MESPATPPAVDTRLLGDSQLTLSMQVDIPPAIPSPDIEVLKVFRL